MKAKFNLCYFHCKQRMFGKSVSIIKSLDHIYAKIVSSGKKSKKFITSSKNLLYFRPLQKLYFVEKLEAHG